MTPEEFISLLEVDKQNAYDVLRPQIHPGILKFLIGGTFDNTKKRLIAYALMPVNKDYFWKYDYLLKFSEGHSSILFNLKKDEIQPPGIYPPGKGVKEKIEEGYYKINLISFLCEYDFDEWNILTSNCFTNSKNQQKIFESELSNLQRGVGKILWEMHIFKETKVYYDEITNRSGREPKIEVSTEMRPFIGHSYLVALIRTRKKRNLNWAYTDYIQKVIFDPLKITLKTFFPDAYYQIDPFSHIQHDLIFPEHRRFCLFICISIDRSKKKRLSFFVYRQENDRIYEWTYFPESTYRKYNLAAHELPKIFNQISQFDTWDYLIKSECTFDDDDFWNNYVFKKENDEYVYLNEIKFH